MQKRKEGSVQKSGMGRRGSGVGRGGSRIERLEGVWEGREQVGREGAG